MIINFSSITEQQPSTRLKANEIHDVVLDNVAISEGKKGDGSTWHALDITFANKDGQTYMERIFEISQMDLERRKIQGANGQEYENPSNAERKIATIAMVGSTFDPVVWEKMQKVQFDFPNDFMKMAQMFVKAMQKSLKKPTKLKLVADNNGYPTLPYFVAIRDNNIVINNRWLGDDVAFTAREIKRMETPATKPQPTEQPEFAPAKIEAKTGSEDSFNLDDLNF